MLLEPIQNTVGSGHEHPEVVEQLRKAYDKWWIRMQPRLVNEDAYQPPAK